MFDLINVYLCLCLTWKSYHPEWIYFRSRGKEGSGAAEEKRTSRKERSELNQLYKISVLSLMVMDDDDDDDDAGCDEYCDIIIIIIIVCLYSASSTSGEDSKCSI